MFDELYKSSINILWDNIVLCVANSSTVFVVVVFFFVISKIKLKLLLRYPWREIYSPSLDMFFILPVYHFKTVSNYYDASTTAIEAQAVM